MCIVNIYLLYYVFPLSVHSRRLETISLGTQKKKKKFLKEWLFQLWSRKYTRRTWNSVL